MLHAFVVALMAALGCQAYLAAGDAAKQTAASASQNAGPRDGQASPASYRQRVAEAVLVQYARDGHGLPEISPPRHVGYFRKTSRLAVRFPLKHAAAKGLLLSYQDPPPRRYRCIDLEGVSVHAEGEPGFSLHQPRLDPAGPCDELLAFEPFTELAQLSPTVSASALATTVP